MTIEQATWKAGKYGLITRRGYHPKMYLKIGIQGYYRPDGVVHQLLKEDLQSKLWKVIK